MNIKSIIYTMLAMCSLTSAVAQTKTIAHRGYWEVEGSVENSISSLRNAQEFGVYGSEFDVWMTSDNVLIVFHDAEIEGKKIEDTPYSQLKDFRLDNGERLPTLEEYLIQGKKSKKTKLVLDLKPHSSKEKEDRAVASIVKMVEKAGMKKQTDYISLSLNVCKEMVRLSPKANVSYCKGDMSPKELKSFKITGIDYHVNALKKNIDWIDEAKKLKMTVTIFFVNSEKDMKEMIDAGVDYITTDKLILAKELTTKK
jgi:Glycerophosphoryl diester phosphodiesterase